jgi:ubiquinone/menaquinone biosynthesis C-methylase UbiE
MERVGTYKELAKYYDFVYSQKDYKKESKEIEKLIKKYKRSDGNSLLEVACGTGKYLEYLNKDFSCMGLDLNEGMLKLARKRVPGMRLVNGDMINFKLNRKFDVIVCLFSSIGYVKTYENLEKTLKNFSKHTKPGGIVIIEPWFTKAEYRLGEPHLAVFQSNDIKIARANVTKARGMVSILERHNLIAEKNKDVRYFVSTDELGMFETSKFLKLMKSAGFNATFLKSLSLYKSKKKERLAGYRIKGLYVGIKA